MSSRRSPMFANITALSTPDICCAASSGSCGVDSPRDTPAQRHAQPSVQKLSAGLEVRSHARYGDTGSSRFTGSQSRFFAGVGELGDDSVQMRCRLGEERLGLGRLEAGQGAAAQPKPNA
jgi:hypothetical protein